VGRGEESAVLGKTGGKDTSLGTEILTANGNIRISNFWMDCTLQTIVISKKLTIGAGNLMETTYLVDAISQSLVEGNKDDRHQPPSGDRTEQGEVREKKMVSKLK